jgi:hypothetical protein
MTKVPDLSGKTVAIVAMGRSNDQFVLAKTHSQEIDEVWAINAMGGVVFHDRMFMLDPASRFLDSEDAGTQTGLMRAVVKNHQGPIYTCELDDRCPGLVEFPLEEVVNAVGTWYLNNTVAYAIAFAIAAKVKKLMIYGVDFSYKGNVHFAEAGRACCEFILAKAVERGIQVGIAQTSSLLDTSLPPNEKLYGYHRLADQPVFSLEEDGRFKKYKYSEVKSKLEEQERVFFDSPPEAVRS